MSIGGHLFQWWSDGRDCDVGGDSRTVDVDVDSVHRQAVYRPNSMYQGREAGPWGHHSYSRGLDIESVLVVWYCK